MKRLTMAALVTVCVLIPTAARADDGGWLEWLFRLDPKLVGVGSQIHLLCLSKAKDVIRCEEWYGIPRLFGNPPDIDYSNIRHELDFRFAFFWKYGKPFENSNDPESIKAFKLMLMYQYHVDDHIIIGFGAGYMPFFGDFPSFSRGILTPLSITYAPWTTGNRWFQKGFFIRGESTYITQGFTAADFGNPAGVTYSTNGGEWNASFAFGFDFRRRTIR